MIIHDVEQGSPEWDALRCRRFTGTKVPKLLMKKSTAGYNDCLDKIVFGIITGKSPKEYVSKDMESGVEAEPEAAMAYELATFNKTFTVGFVERDEWRGCSPDRFVGTDGMAQIKCPKWNTFLNAKYEGDGLVIPFDYQIQMQWEMYCSERKWNDYVCYYPGFDPIIKRLEFDKTVIATLETEIELAIKEVEKRINKLSA